MHVNNKNLTLYHATDPHLFFTFNGTYSRNCNLFIVNDNKGGGTKFVASPDNTVSFATPDYQNNTYYLGTTKKQKTFKHTVAANMLSQHEVQQILQWLKVGEVGFLSYDTNPYWGWDVVVTSVGDVSQYEASDGSIIEFAVEFKTINDWHARSNYDAVKQFGSDAANGFADYEYDPETDIDNLISHSIANEYGIPEIVADIETITDEEGNETTQRVIYLPQVSDEHSFVNFNWLINGDSETHCTVQVNENTTYHYDYTFAAKSQSYTVNYLGQYGFSLINDKIIEDTDYLTKNSVGTSDLMILNNELPIDVTHLWVADQEDTSQVTVFSRKASPQVVSYDNLSSVLGYAVLGQIALNNSDLTGGLNAQWQGLGIGAYKCEVYWKEPSIGWETKEFAIGATGNNYGVKIKIITNLTIDDDDGTVTDVNTVDAVLGTCTGVPQKVYIGKCNKFSIPLDTSGTITTIKHNSL